MAAQKELIVIRSLAESDLGIFAAHRASATSKQRAININTSVARRLLSPELFEAGGAQIECICVLGPTRIASPRHFGRVGKNWRLGGHKIEGAAFASLDSKDFMLIRSVEGNDGTFPIGVTFVGRNSDRVVHAGIAAIVGRVLKQSMAVYGEDDPGFRDLAKFCSPAPGPSPSGGGSTGANPPSSRVAPKPKPPVPPMPRDPLPSAARRRSVRDKMRAPHILEKMMQVAGDLSGPAQFRFMQTVGELADQLRQVLLATDGIITIDRDHRGLWGSVAGKPIGFIDGGLANLSMVGSAPIAARVGGYVVTPGDTGADREQFTVLKQMIDELYAHSAGGVYSDSFPDIGALRDAARISIEAAGAVKLVSDQPNLSWVMVHGALVNPVSRYTDVMADGLTKYAFPDFSAKALEVLLPPEKPARNGADRNFIAVHRRQLEILQAAAPIVCGVVERESSTSSVAKAVIDALDNDAIEDLLPMPPGAWKAWFLHALNPADDHESEGQRITDSLLFRCVLEPGEALRPVLVDRNDERRAPKKWAEEIKKYPKPWVSYLQPTEWSAPIRVEIFDAGRARFEQTAALVMHCALLLPRYAFPAGLDIVDKFAKIPNWMARPVNAQTAVTALRSAMDSGDDRLFDALRRMLCGSTREWLLRPGIMR